MGGRKTTLFLITGIILLILSVFVFYYFIGQREEVRKFVNGSYSSWLLYAQTCTIGNIRDEVPINTLREEAEYCNQTNPNSQVGYYVYDFNIKRSVYVDNDLMDVLTMHDILSFPSSFYSLVKGGSSEFDTITPLNKFTEFDISCKDFANALTCVVDGETHAIARSKNLDLLIPQGMVQGPDWYKLLKPRFFPLAY